MIKWIKKQLTNKYFLGEVIFFIIGVLFAGISLGLIYYSDEILGDLISTLIWIAVLIMCCSFILCFIFWIIMAFRQTIYGNKVEHNKAFWEDIDLGEKALPKEDVNNPYLLDVRHKKPVLIFVLGILTLVLSPVVLFNYIYGSEGVIKQVLVLCVIIYFILACEVFCIRLLRRFRAFRVKINKNIRKEELYVQQDDSDFH